MRSVLLLDLLFTFVAITDAMDSWAFDDESLFSNSNLALDASVLPVKELALAPSDQNESPSLFALDLPPENSETDTSGLLPWDLNGDSALGSSFDDLGIHDSFKLADCSASENLTPFDKLRTRRNENLGKCEQNPDGLTGDTQRDPESIQKLLETQLGAEEIPMAGLTSKDQNQFCFLLSLGVLPWGVCSSGDPADELLVIMDPITINGNPQALAYTLSHCTLGTSTSICTEHAYLQIPFTIHRHFEAVADFLTFLYL